MTDKFLGKKSQLVRDQMSAVAGSLDEGDPIYDSESEGDCMYTAYLPTNTSKTSQSRRSTAPPPHLTVAEFHAKVDSMMSEFFLSSESTEVVQTLGELQQAEYYDLFVYWSVLKSLDQNEKKQRALSGLLTLLYDSHVISSAHIYWGFEKLIQSSNTLQLDVPGFIPSLTFLLDFAIEDELLPPDYYTTLPEEFLEGIVSPLNETTPSPQRTPEESVVKEVSEVRERKTEEIKKILTDLRLFKQHLHLYLADFFNSGYIAEARDFIEAAPHRVFKHEFVRGLLKEAMCDKTDMHRELASKVLSDLYGKNKKSDLRMDEVELGFARLLGSSEDLILDCPNLVDLTAKFIVRGLVDDILPPAIISTGMRLKLGGETGVKTLVQAQKWVDGKREAMLAGRFRKIWTHSDIHVPEVRLFKETVHGIIFEYFHTKCNDDLSSAVNRLEASPDQAAEIVRKLMYFAMDCKKPQREAALEAMKHLRTHSDVDSAAILKGFDSAYTILNDFKIDVPKAERYMDEFRQSAIAGGLLPDTYADPRLLP